MKIAMAQVNPIIGDFDHNADGMIDYAERARRMGCDLVVFSELSVIGYPPRDLLEKRDFVRNSLACLDRLVETIRGIGVICGFAEPNPAEAGNDLFNAGLLFKDGRRLHTARKRLLPTYDIFDERRYFEPGSATDVVAFGGHRIGLTVCEDVWNDPDVFARRIYDQDPVRDMVAAGADLIINISASPYFLGKRRFRRHMLGTIARKYGIPVVYVNQVGGNDSVLFDGTSLAFDRAGEVAARGADFVEDLVVFDTETGRGDLHPESESENEIIHKALVMGTRDYVHKCGFSQAVIGLSGGIDSALTACIAADALGSDNVRTVFMPSRYTDPDNFEDTRQLAGNLGVDYEIIPIDEIYRSFVSHLGGDLDADDPGVTEQNIQARVRGTLLMALSNRYGHLVLSTGNKSELAIGYCTLYGDMNGGLAVISDLPKTRVWDLSRWINRNGEVIPIRIIEKEPSAELKPNQTDGDDLPPYEVLDGILKGYVEEGKGAADLVAEGFDRELVADVIRRVDRNEYKRQQAALGLKVTSKAFGYGRRHPIAQRYRWSP